jgi:hypothetical protein
MPHPLDATVKVLLVFRALILWRFLVSYDLFATDEASAPVGAPPAGWVRLSSAQMCGLAAALASVGATYPCGPGDESPDTPGIPAWKLRTNDGQRIDRREIADALNAVLLHVAVEDALPDGVDVRVLSFLAEAHASGGIMVA